MLKFAADLVGNVGLVDPSFTNDRVDQHLADAVLTADKIYVAD
jgi:hypothetical protein